MSLPQAWFVVDGQHGQGCSTLGSLVVGAAGLEAKKAIPSKPFV